MQQYSTEPRIRECVKGYGFSSFARKYKKPLSNTGLDVLKTASKKVVHKASEFIGNKIADAVTNSNDDNIQKKKAVEEILIPPEKRDEISNQLRKVLKKWNTIKYLNY